jgi:hypothetical protein
MEPTMAEIIPMTEEQKFQLEIYKLVMNQNAAAEEAFQFIGTDELKLTLSPVLELISPASNWRSTVLARTRSDMKPGRNFFRTI